jgi:UDP-2,3-diacylglucosamine pyrophosphatase LpxH
MKQYNPKKRFVDAVVISDVHLGTYGCHAKELLRYLKSIKTKKLILNGDIIDGWQFNKRYFPASHMKVLKYILTLVTKKTKVFYITGNHDEMLRKFAGYKMGSLEITNKLVFEHDGKKTWIFHGDVFDVTMQHSKWLAKLGSIGYDTLIVLNRLVNFVSEKMGHGKLSFSKKIKNSVKKAVSYVNDFEQLTADIAIANKYDHVICGHVHQPEKKLMSNNHGQVVYLNSGDWVENLTALELNDGEWTIFTYKDSGFPAITKNSENETQIGNNKELFNDLVLELSQTLKNN